MLPLPKDIFAEPDVSPNDLANLGPPQLPAQAHDGAEPSHGFPE
jgi:hypothetical protein